VIVFWALERKNNGIKRAQFKSLESPNHIDGERTVATIRLTPIAVRKKVDAREVVVPSSLRNLRLKASPAAPSANLKTVPENPREGATDKAIGKTKK
jgi:hypothetical protein